MRIRFSVVLVVLAALLTACADGADQAAKAAPTAAATVSATPPASAVANKPATSTPIPAVSPSPVPTPTPTAAPTTAAAQAVPATPAPAAPTPTPAAPNRPPVIGQPRITGTRAERSATGGSVTAREFFVIPSDPEDDPITCVWAVAPNSWRRIAGDCGGATLREDNDRAKTAQAAGEIVNPISVTVEFRDPNGGVTRFTWDTAMFQ